MILCRLGMPEDVVIAGILHDVVEDTPTTIEQVRELFGDHVADLVAAVTDPPNANFKQRLEYHLQQIKNTNDEVRAIKAADVLHNLYSKVLPGRAGKKHPWHLHDNTREENLAGVHTRLEAFRKYWQSPILDDIEKYLRELESHN